MGRPVANKLEPISEPAFLQHAICVAAYRENAALFDDMVTVERECAVAVFQAAFVNYSLTVILA